MKFPRFVLATCIAASVSTAGCDIALDSYSAYAFIKSPRAQQTLYVGEGFRLTADIEAESAVDSLAVVFRPISADGQPIRIPLHVPEALREGEPNLKARIDTTIAISTMPAEGVTRHMLSITTYVQQDRVGSSSGIPVHLERRQPE